MTLYKRAKRGVGQKGVAKSGWVGKAGWCGLRNWQGKVFGSLLGAGLAVRPRNVELEREMINTLRPN